jgi:integrase
LPLLLALRTGQRQGDLLRLTWTAYDGSVIRLKQSKSIGKKRRVVRVEIPVGAPLKVALDAALKVKQSPLILLNSDKRPWTPDGFRASFN